MITLWTALVIHGRRTFAQVPERWMDEVKADLDALGLGTDGMPVQPSISSKNTDIR